MQSNIYNYEMIRTMMKSPKRDLLPNDVLIYKNGEKAVLNQHIFKVVFDKGEINKLIRFNNYLFAFQDSGIAQILYNGKKRSN